MRKKRRRCLIIGEGRVSSAVVLSMLNHPELGWQPVGIISEIKEGVKYVFGIPVFRGLDKINKVFFKRGAEDIIVAQEEEDAKRLRLIINYLKGLGTKLKLYPPNCLEPDAEEADLRHIREVKPEDLLQKPAFYPPWKEYSSYIKDKVVLITGGAGSIGFNLAKLILRNLYPASIVLVDRDENSVAYLHTLFREDKTVNIVLGDIQDKYRMEEVFNKFSPSIVFHTAAYKHLPLMESAPQEAVKNNIWATKVLLESAKLANTERFVMVSTDKAANPTSIMGATKRFTELLLSAHQLIENIPQKVCSVRLCNVIGSKGSVIPLFLERIERKEPLYVTHPEVTRHFMTPEYACQLIILIGGILEGGEVFAVDIGESLNILQLAESLIILSGYSPYDEIGIEIIGLRKGEKLKEELKSNVEELEPTLFPKVWHLRINERFYKLNPQDILNTSDKLYNYTREGKTEEIINELKRTVPDFSYIN